MSQKSLKTVNEVNSDITVLNPPSEMIEVYMREQDTDDKDGVVITRPVSQNEPGVNPTPAPAPSAPIDVTDVKSYCWQKLKSLGFSDQAAAGVMGNIEKESGFQPDNKSSSGYYGLFQLDPAGRLLGLQQAFPTNYNTAEAQMDYFAMEWSSFQYNTYCSDSYYNKQGYARAAAACNQNGYAIPTPFTLTSKEAFQSSTNVNECTFLFAMGFERPGSKDPIYLRCQYANQYLATFGGK